MSADELLVLVASGIGAAAMWWRWYRTALAFARVGPPYPLGVLAYAAPVGALALLGLVLRTAASADVRDDLRYLAFYAALGALWVASMLAAARLIGFDPRGDVLERRNPAAMLAWTAAVLAHTVAFAGANIGNGPGWWVVLFSGSLAAAAVFVAWILYARFSPVMEEITVERSAAAAWRLGGLLLGAALVAGRAAAGDWIDAGSTLRDFVRAAWVVVPLAVVAILLDRSLRALPARGSAHRSAPAGPVFAGILPAFINLCLTAIWLLHLGRW